jgi:hypothetical protein
MINLVATQPKRQVIDSVDIQYGHGDSK